MSGHLPVFNASLERGRRRCQRKHSITDQCLDRPNALSGFLLNELRKSPDAFKNIAGKFATIDFEAEPLLK